MSKAVSTTIHLLLLQPKHARSNVSALTPTAAATNKRLLSLAELGYLIPFLYLLL